MSEPPDLTVENESLTITEERFYSNITVGTSGSLYIQAYVKAKKLTVTGSASLVEISGSAGYLEITVFGTGIFDELGNAFISGSIVTRVLEIKEGRGVSNLRIGASEYLQYLGDKNRVFRVEMVATGSDLSIPRNMILNIAGKKGFLTTTLIPLTYVIFLNPEITMSGDRPMEIKGAITAVEFK